MDSNKKIARISGLWYLLLAITGAYSMMVVASKIYISGDAVATANNILANEFLFRSGIAGQLISQTSFVFLVLALCRLLKHVNEHQAKLMVALVIVSVPIAFVAELFSFTSLMILKGEIATTLELAQKQDWAILFFKIHNYTIAIVEIFWGLWLIPLGQLFYKSGFMPRIISILLIAGGVAYVIASFTFLLFPSYVSMASDLTMITSIGELATILWLLIIGVRVRKPKEVQL
jgi:hypothetical protein